MNTEAVEPLPEGTLTVLFSDVEGSTGLVSRLGPRWGEALSAQRSILRAAFQAHGGTEMGTEGDSFFVVFRSARDAVAAAVDAQRSLQAHQWPDDGPVRVRMGLHTGEPQRHEEGYIGLDVHRGARIAATAAGGQIVVSESTRQLLGGPVDGVVLRDLGWHRLKDLPEAEHLHDVVAEGLASQFPPLRSLGTLANLPVPATELVGREAEVADLESLLRRDGVRLVTLTGPGGSGKTRLALQIAMQMGDRFLGGVYFVSLSAADRAALLWAGVAEALAATGSTDELPRERVRRFLHDRHSLLVLDNLEQVGDADVAVSELLSDAPHIQVLATSRRPLHLVAEHERPVAPLDVPHGDQGPQQAAVTVAEAERSGAVRMFVQRAQMARPGFRLGPDNVADVVALCARLDGLPLAIELAAAGLRLLTPRALLRRLDPRLGTGVTAADRPERQRTIGATIAWSHDLLEPADQVVFHRLSAFAGAVSIEAVEQVAGGDDADPLDSLARLVDASLVQVGEGPDGEPRVSMLQTVRDFARERLLASPEADAVMMRHATWCADIVEDLVRQMTGSTQMSALDRLDAILDEVRAALDYCLRPGDNERLACGFRMVASLSWYWYRHGYLVEGRGWHERALAVAGDDSPELAQSMHGMAVLMLQQNEAEPAIGLLQRVLDIAQRNGDRSMECRELNSLGAAYRHVGETERSLELIRRSAELAKEIGDENRLSTAMTNLAVIYSDIGDYSESLRWGREALVIDTRRGDVWGTTLLQANLVFPIMQTEGPEAALVQLSQIAGQAITLGDSELTSNVLDLCAMVVAGVAMSATPPTEDLGLAARLLGASEAYREQVGVPRTEPDEKNLQPWMTPAQRATPDELWQRCYAEGRMLPPEEAVALTVQTRVGAGRSGQSR